MRLVQMKNNQSSNSHPDNTKSEIHSRKKFFDPTARTLHEEIPPAKDRIKHYKRKMFEK